MSTRALTSPLGLISAAVVHAAGQGVDALWKAALHGRTGLRMNPLEWCDLPCWVGAVPDVEDSALGAHLGDWDCRNHRLVWLALQDIRFRNAVVSARDRYGGHRVAVIVGTSTSGIRSTETAYPTRRARGRWPGDFNYRKTHSTDALCRFVAEQLQLQGPMATVSTACSSSAKAFLLAQRWIATGIVDAAIVGGADSLCLSTLHGFHALQLLSEDMCRPFDSARNGISIGEAAGFMLLAAEPAAVRLSGGGETSDAWHMSTPHPEGDGARDAMLMALETANLCAAEIGWVNAHGTGTAANDRSEALALQAVFGENKIPVSSTKGITGHTLAAAGIVEAIITAAAVERSMLPPSANLQTPDESLRVATVTEGRHAKLNHAISNSFGFGGSNCSLILSASE